MKFLNEIDGANRVKEDSEHQFVTESERIKLSELSNYTHPTTEGNKHIPTGGASGQVLKYSESGTATWQADNDTITTVNGKTGAITKADIVALGIPSQDTVVDISGKADKTYVDGKVKTDVPENAVFTDTIVDISNKADKSQVLTNVPAGAKFTDTITTINGKTGAIAKADIVALGIPAQDTVVDISGKVDKVAGKGLSTEDYTTAEKTKLAGVATGANNYTHPANHPPSIITQDENNRFVTDTEKAAWSGKAASSHTHSYAGSASAGGAATTALACTGNAATATILATARNINGVSFNGSADITIADSTKLPLAGGTVTGVTTFSDTTAATSTTTGAVKISGGLGVAGTIYGNTIYGAVWNDYAEYRITNCKDKVGYVVCENNDDTLSLSTRRLQRGSNIISDTFGFAIGETEEADTPIAISGRVLAYTDTDRNKFKCGQPVCSGKDGKISRMTKIESILFPECVIGYVSAIPHYEYWGTGKVKVDNRIWIKVK